MFRVEFRPGARRDLAALPGPDRARVAPAIEALARHPRPPGCVKLEGSDLLRICIGDYRVIYEIRDRVLTVLVVRVAHRRKAYR